MPPNAPADRLVKSIWYRASLRPRLTVVLCFVAVFAITLILAVHQYFLVRARELDQRLHRLELQAMTLDVAVQNNKQQLRFLRTSAERMIAGPSAPFSPALDAPFQTVLKAQEEPVWSLRLPESDVPIRGVGARQLANIPGLQRTESTFLDDLRLSRLMSRLLSVQFRLSTNLERTAFVSATGVVVAYPALSDEQTVGLVQSLASSRLLQVSRQHPLDYDVIFDPMYERKSSAGPRLLFGTPVMRNDVVRGVILFVIPQRAVQDYMRLDTTPDEIHALVQRNGTAIATSENTFTATDENRLGRLPAPWNDLSVAPLFQTGGGVLSAHQSLLLYTKLPSTDLVLIDYVPAKAVFLAVVRLTSAVFAGIWLLLGFLLWATLLVVDQLLARQIALSDQLKALSRVDPLTNLANRRRLDEEFNVFARGRHADRCVAFLMIDIDHFKRVNDVWGHTVGDEVLRHLAGVTTAVVRPPDLVARFGGEEFCVLLPNASADDAARVAERIRLAVAQTAFTPGQAELRRFAPGSEIWITVSIGVAEMVSDNCPDLESLVAVADQRLYAAKEGGRNRVVADGPARSCEVGRQQE
ncbi:diguanylate cyclase [Paraburkholderia sp. CNPSo 3272]|uniref:diguanylate cyclase n=1 Tax=Paraburkholderia sp. CNPSo 3272 TaxID=2940931 RepID=UPI0020B6ABFB|nr:diguanylate cyclase [Paraburkholderia sp. CNPSo 3272]MCP3727453.1 diguanylate cyclase [Paraburkholderia sp. CNPSo 3272]